MHLGSQIKIESLRICVGCGARVRSQRLVNFGFGLCWREMKFLNFLSLLLSKFLNKVG